MLRLGLDLGTNSIGWALLRLSDDEQREPVELVDGGVLIHADGRDPKSRASNAATRREKRGPRRNRDRMLVRRRRVANLLHDLGLLPDDEARDAVRNLDPVQPRSEALDRPLTAYELGRVLLSFANRRGFKSNRKADSRGEDSKIRQDTDELRQRMAQAGARTLGDYLWRRHRKGKTIRARLGNGLYPDREMVRHELESIREAQASHHEDVAGEDWDAIVETLLFQRELRPVDRGRCTLIPSEDRAYKAYPLFQEFRIWQEVRNINTAESDGPFQPLSAEERERVAQKLKSTKVQKFERLFPDRRVNLSTSARKGLDGDLTAAALRKQGRFGKLWDKLDIDRQQEIVERLLDETNDHAELTGWLRNECELSEDEAEATASASLPPGTTHLSKAAIEQLLPHMREGMLYHEAVEAAGFRSHSDIHGDGTASRLPYYGEILERDVIGGRGEDGRNDVERFGRITNPTVHIALGQMRRLFNAIVDEFGKPDEVVVELARDLKQSREERERDLKRNNENRERNERLRQCAVDAGVENPSSLDMRKLRLWDEQGPPDARVCPFTGAVLSVEKLLSEQTEIEHILPYSLSLDDSMANTVISMRSANREKGQKTPYEAWGSEPDRYREIRARAALLPPNKQWRFEEDAMGRLNERGGFLARHLNDTRYLSRATRLYLAAAVHPDRVRVTPGQLTAMLRHAWGLNSLLSGTDRKERDDHRHHLIDAVVVGMTSQALLQRVASESARAVDDLGGRVAEAVEDPWHGFRNDVKTLVDRVVVRHRPDHFTVHGDRQERRKRGQDVTTGPLHNDTAYGIVDGPDDQGMVTLVESKPLDSLEPKRLKDIRDLALRERLCELWDRLDATDRKPAEKRRDFADYAQERYGVRRVRILTKMSEGSLAFIGDGAGRKYKAYKTDGNAFMDVWLLPDGRTQGETVSRFNAHQLDFHSAVKRQHPTAKKLMRLHRDDMVAIGDGDQRRILRVKELSGGRVRAVDHWRGGKAKEMPLVNIRDTRVLKEGLRRVAVDVLGRVRDRGPREEER